MQRMHFQVRVGVFSCQGDFVIFDIVLKTNRMWFSVICTLIDNDTCHHSGQNVVRIKLSYFTKRALCFSY